MGRDTLRRSIQYGHGERSSTGQRNRKLGKFGVGLVAASISQCAHLEVMSWQHGEARQGKVLATEVKISDDMSDAQNILPTPESKTLPDWTGSAFIGMATPILELESGTLVIWHNVTPTWKQAITLQENLSHLCGRIYRELIQYEKVSMVVNVFDGSTMSIESTKEVALVDPMFLKNWDHDGLKEWGFVGENTLFQPYTGLTGDSGRNQDGKYEPEMFSVGNGETEIGPYLIMASYRREEVGTDPKYTKGFREPGQTSYGKLARKLLGVSILRNGREIELDPAWLRSDKTVDRWVSVSLDFDASLDEIFGVSNDKQSAHRLSGMTSSSIDEIKAQIKSLEEESSDDFKEIECLKAALRIKERLQDMQRIIRDQRSGSRSKHGSPTSDPSRASIAELSETGRKISVGGPPLPLDGINPSDHQEETTKVYVGTMTDGLKWTPLSRHHFPNLRYNLLCVAYRLILHTLWPRGVGL